MLLARLALVSIVFGASAPAIAAPPFCARLAKEIGLVPKTDRNGSYWQKNALNPAQRLLVGGTSFISLGAEPLDKADDAERQRQDDMCNVEAKGIVCNILGPTRIKAMIGDVKAKVDAESGERAKLWTTGSRVRCQDMPTG